MAKEPVEKAEVVEADTSAAPQTVPIEDYQRLYEQATNLDARYKKLVAAYNALLELFLSSK